MMKNKTIGRWLADIGGGCWSCGSTVAILLLFRFQPTWTFVWISAAEGFGLIVLGGIVDVTREIIREKKEGRI